MKKIVFFDRDETLIKDVPYLNDPSLIELFDDTISTLLKLKSKGYEFIIVTNQSGVPRGLITEEQLAQVHDELLRVLEAQGIEILSIYYSPHLPDSNHPSRKPNPGMLLQAFDEFDIDKSQSLMVGDKISDGKAGLNAGLKSFILNKKLDGCVTLNNLSQLLDYI